MWYWTTSHCFYYASSFQGLNSKNFSHFIILEKISSSEMFHTICVILIFACFSISSFRIFAFFGFNSKSTFLQQLHLFILFALTEILLNADIEERTNQISIYFSVQLVETSVQFCGYPNFFNVGWLFIANQRSKQFNLYPSLGCCGSSRFVPTEFHPAGDSPSCPAQWSEARLKFGISLEICDIKNAHKKGVRQGGADL